MRLIDADALKQSVNECDVCNVCPERKARCSYDCEFPDYLTPKFEALIDAQPTIEPKRGEWINKDPYWHTAICSNCNKVTMFEEWDEEVIEYDFCPNCGAKMKGADDE